MDSSTEIFKVVLDEIRKNTDKIDKTRDDIYAQISNLESKIDRKLAKSEIQHQELYRTQDLMQAEHRRMNDLLEVHIKRTDQNEQKIEDTQKVILEHIDTLKTIKMNAEYQFKDLSEELDSIKTEIKPVIVEKQEKIAIEKFTKRKISTTAKVLGLVSLALTVVTGILKLLEII